MTISNRRVDVVEIEPLLFFSETNILFHFGSNDQLPVLQLSVRKITTFRKYFVYVEKKLDRTTVVKQLNCVAINA